MFSQAGGGGVHPPGQTPSGADPFLGRPLPGQTPPLGRHPPQADGCCSGWYASYWSVFLFFKAAAQM